MGQLELIEILHKNITESLPKFFFPTSCDVYNLETHTHIDTQMYFQWKTESGNERGGEEKQNNYTDQRKRSLAIEVVWLINDRLARDAC